MRKYFAFGLLVTAGLFANSAWAFEVDLGKHAPDEIQSTCTKVGGRYYSSGSNWGCQKTNCDGKGGNCAVDCHEDGCKGITPERTSPPLDRRNLLGILTLSPGKNAGPPGPNPLEATPGGSPQNPSGMGTPKPSAPAPIKLQ